MPFEAFTPKATMAFVDGLRAEMSNLEEYTKEMVGKLDRKYQKIRERLERLGELMLNQQLESAEYEQRLAPLKREHDLVFAELSAFRKADHSTFDKGLDLIQHFTNLKDF